MIEYLLYSLTLCLLFCGLTLSLNMVMGYLGYLHLGHIAFWGIGSYTFAILTLNGWGFFEALLAGGFVAACCGFILGTATLRLKSHYIAITTLGFLYIVHSLIINTQWLTRGPLGIPGIPKPEIFGNVINTNGSFFILTLLTIAIISFFIHRILSSPFGKILETIREDEIASISLGKNSFKYKMIIFVMSAFCAGIIGGITASFFNFISPNDFFMNQTIFIITALMLGGAGAFWGSFVGTFLLYVIQESMLYLPFSPNSIGAMRTLVSSLILIAIMLWRPNGILGKKLKNY